MFVTLLLVTFVVATLVCFATAALFKKPITAILQRIVAEDLGAAWQRYVTFAIYVVGIGGGVRVHQLERYIASAATDDAPLVLTSDRWVLEVYRTVIEALQSMAWMLLVFFVFALIAFVVVRGFEFKHEKRDAGRTGA